MGYPGYATVLAHGNGKIAIIVDRSRTITDEAGSDVTAIYSGDANYGNVDRVHEHGVVFDIHRR